MKEILQTVIREQRQRATIKNEVERQVPAAYMRCREILVISGVRRCGKSVLLHQIKKKQKERDYVLNFDDERLIDFKMEHFQELHEVFVELFGVQKTFYFDEIQNIRGWEMFVRRLYDSGCKVFITGSNASMLSRELGTHLTGRYVQYELFPFSFGEFLQFKRYPTLRTTGLTTVEKGKIMALFAEYQKKGGFPVFLSDDFDEYLKYLYESVLYRDVLVRNKLVNEKEMLQMVNYLASSIARPFTHTSLAKVIGVKNVTTVKNYLGYVEDTYLLFQILKFDYSLKAQHINPKKVYFIDNALAMKLGFQSSPDQGRWIENLVFIELKRRRKDVFYHWGATECDFVIREGYKITEAIQVCYSLSDEITKQRETAGLMDALNAYNLSEGLILTADQESRLKKDGKNIRVMPVWKWLLQANKNL